MMLEPRNVGDPIRLNLSGPEFYLLRMGIKELVNQIDDAELQTLTGIDAETMGLASRRLGEIWWEMDDDEAKSFIPGT